MADGHAKPVHLAERLALRPSEAASRERGSASESPTGGFIPTPLPR